MLDKKRNRLGNDRADKKSFVVFNLRQMKRVNECLIVHRRTGIESCMVNGLSDYLLKQLRECIGLGIDEGFEIVLEEDETDPESDVCILTEVDVDVLL